MYGGFVVVMTGIQKEIHKTAVEKGFWEGERNDGEAIALMHQELSEALDGLRDGNPVSEKIGAPFTQVEEEMADLVIRVMDFCAGRGHHLPEAILAKMAYNLGREYKHGRKF